MIIFSMRGRKRVNHVNQSVIFIRECIICTYLHLCVDRTREHSIVLSGVRHRETEVGAVCQLSG